MPKKVLAIFAHPDDESFGPGGTIAQWTTQGATVHLVCATKGQAGRNNSQQETSLVREAELLKAAKILGIQKVDFLTYVDGHIGNNDLPIIEKKLSSIISQFKPDTLITYDLNGVSGHLDHMAMASAATQAFKKTRIAKYLYYYCLPKKLSDGYSDYFIYFPPGKTPDQIDKIIDVSSSWRVKVQAMKAHQSQIKDVNHILKHEQRAQEECFIVKTLKDFPLPQET